MSLILARAILIFLSEGAMAAAPSEQVSWSGPAECIDEASLIAKVAEAKSKEAVSPLHHVRGTATPSPSGYRFVLELLEGATLRGQRVMEIDGDNCRKEDDALALIVAMLLEGSVSVDPAPPVESPKPAPPPATVIPRPTLPKTQVEADSSPGVRYTWGLSLGLGLGLLPQASPSLGGLAMATWEETFSLRLTTYYQFPSRTGGTSLVELGALAGGLSVCRELSLRRADFGLCAGISLMALHGRGQGFEDNRSSWSILPGAELSLPVGWQLGGLRLEISPSAIFPWKRVQYEALGTTLHKTEAVLGQLALSSTWEF